MVWVGVVVSVGGCGGDVGVSESSSRGDADRCSDVGGFRGGGVGGCNNVDGCSGVGVCVWWCG